MEIMLKGNMLDEPTKELSAELGVDAPKLSNEPSKQTNPVAAVEKTNDVKPAAIGTRP